MNVQRCYAGQQVGQRLADRRKVLVEIGRNVERILDVDRQAETRPDLLDILLGGRHSVFGDIQRGLGLIEILRADRPFADQRFKASVIALRKHQIRLLDVELGYLRFERRELVSDILHRMFEAVAVAAGLGQIAAHLILRHQDIRLRRLDRGLLQLDLDFEGSLSSCTSKSPWFTRLLSSTRTLVTCPATRAATNVT